MSNVYFAYNAYTVPTVYIVYVGYNVYILYTVCTMYTLYTITLCTLRALFTLNVYIATIVRFANIASFTKQLQNRAHAAKLRQAHSKLDAASFPYHIHHGDLYNTVQSTQTFLKVVQTLWGSYT